MHRCAVSIPSNIAEGAGRGTKKEFSQFLDIAQGSSFEFETQLLISSNLNYLEKEKFKAITIKLNEVQKMMTGLKKSVKTNN